MGNVVVAGTTTSSDLPHATNSYKGGEDGFVAKLTPDGTLLWTTYLGGTARDYLHNLAVDSQGNVYVTGNTQSTDFVGAANSHSGATDAYVAKLSPSGTLLHAVFVGGSGADGGGSVSIDHDGTIVLAGFTAGLPDANNDFQGGTADAFLATLRNLDDTHWGQVIYSTHIGGRADDHAYGLALDAGGFAIITGWTKSDTLPASTNMYSGASDAFVSRLDIVRQTTQWSTYLGGSGEDQGYRVATDSSGQIYAVGFSNSGDFNEAVSSNHGGRDGFLAKVLPDGSPAWTRLFGGAANDELYGVVVSTNDNIIVRGTTGSADITPALNTFGGGRDALVANVSSHAEILGQMYFGSSGNDDGRGVIVDREGCLYISGITTSTNLPSQTNTLKGATDPFVAKINLTQTHFGPPQMLVGDARGVESVFAIDVNGDQMADVLSASYHDGKIAWYKNLGNGSFDVQRVITSDAKYACSVYAADLNGDQKPDVMSASYGTDRIAWYENLGGGEFGPPQVLTGSTGGAISVYAADLDRDGLLDVVAAFYRTNRVSWYKNRGGGVFDPERVISTSARAVEVVFAADMDGDGYIDVLSASADDDKIAWYRNLGNDLFGIQQVITTLADGARGMHAADLDDDGDTDVLSASVYDDKIAWYENTGNGTFGQQRVLSRSADGPEAVFASDLDADGDFDVLSASSNDNKVAWYENLGRGVFGSQQVITASANGMASVFAADLDNDGDPDVLSAWSSANRVVWHENLRGVDPPFEILARGVAYAHPRDIQCQDSGEYAKHVCFDGNELHYIVDTDAVFGDPDNPGFYAIGLLSDYFGPALVIRGSNDLIDFWDDLNPNGVGYWQFINNWEEGAQIKRWLSALPVPADIVGHSLGGALAQWIAAAFTSDGGGIDHLTTFNSPGISNSRSTYPDLEVYADQFDPELATSVTHYVVNGDLVSMAGEAFVAGKANQTKQVRMASFPDWNLLHNHVLPLVTPSVGDRKRPPDISWTNYDSVSYLNDAGYSHSDLAYKLWLVGAETSLCSLSVLDKRLLRYAHIPPMLLFRGTTEFVRRGQDARDIRTSLLLMEYAYQGVKPLIDWTVDAAGNFVLEFSERAQDLFQATRVTVDKEFGLTVDAGNPPMLRLDGGLSVNLGDDIDIDLPSWLGGPFVADHLLTLADMDMEGVIDRNHLNVNGDVKLLGNTATVSGTAMLDLLRGELTIGGTLDIMDGLVAATGQVTATIGANLNLVLAGRANVHIPNEVPWIGGVQLAGGDFLMNYVSDSNISNDFVAGWGTLFGIPLGVRVWFDGRLPEILGAREIDKLGDPGGDGEAPLPYGESYAFPTGKEWSLFLIEWNNPSADVTFSIRTPSGLILSEADILADPMMEVVGELSNDRRRAILVKHPEGGVWDVSVQDTTNLGVVDMTAMLPESLPTVDLVSASGGLFRQPIDVQIAASAPVSNVSVALFYDTNADGLDGVMITDSLIPVDGRIAYRWDTSNVAAGEYFLYARVLDDYNPPEYAYSPNSICITDHEVGGVAINQAGSQGDPTRTPSIEFSVVFSEPVNDFETADVVISGTAQANHVIIANPSSDHVNYVVAISGMVRSGSVIATIRADAVHDEQGNANTASVSTDNEVAYICPWQNFPNRLDVNNNSYVSPLDALMIINRLNQQGAGRLPFPAPGLQPPPYYDVSGDHFVSPLDALIVINYLNSRGGQGEGEREAVDSCDRMEAVSPTRAGDSDFDLFSTDAPNLRKAGDGPQVGTPCHLSLPIQTLDLLYARLDETMAVGSTVFVNDSRDSLDVDLMTFLERILNAETEVDPLLCAWGKPM